MGILNKDNLKNTQITIIIVVIAIFSLLDVLTTLFGVYGTNSFVEEIEPLAGPEYSINNFRVAGSLIFDVLLLIYILFFNLWQYKIIKVLLWVWLVRVIITVVINGYTISVLLSPLSH
jgi:hypothetical protein